MSLYRVYLAAASTAYKTHTGCPHDGVIARFAVCLSLSALICPIARTRGGGGAPPPRLAFWRRGTYHIAFPPCAVETCAMPPPGAWIRRAAPQTRRFPHVRRFVAASAISVRGQKRGPTPQCPKHRTAPPPHPRPGARDRRPARQHSVVCNRLTVPAAAPHTHSAPRCLALPKTSATNWVPSTTPRARVDRRPVPDARPGVTSPRPTRAPSAARGRRRSRFAGRPPRHAVRRRRKVRRRGGTGELGRAFRTSPRREPHRARRPRRRRCAAPIRQPSVAAE